MAWQETFHLEKASAGDEVQVQAWDKDMGSGRRHCTTHINDRWDCPRSFRSCHHDTYTPPSLRFAHS